MIIEAGYDVLEILAPKVFTKRSIASGMWVLLLDADLRNIRVAKLKVKPTDDWDTRVSAIAKALKSKKNYRQAKYFVVARLDTALGEALGDRESEWQSQCGVLKSSRSFGGAELLGSVLSWGADALSSVPRFSFRDYLSLEHLPRPAICHGPHSFMDCPCLACTEYENRLKSARVRTATVPVLKG